MRRAINYLHHNEVWLQRIPAELVKNRRTGKRILWATHGLCLDDEIVIDPRYDVVPTIVHEILHGLHPDWDEKTVLREEKRVFRGLSPEQVVRLFKEFALVL